MALSDQELATYLNKFDYKLPKELIAQQPVTPRDLARLMVVDRFNGNLAHYHFFDLPTLLDNKWVVVINDTKVFPARLFGYKLSGGKVEILLAKRLDEYLWEALSHPGLKVGERIECEGVEVKVLEKRGKVLVIESSLDSQQLLSKLEDIGNVPVPPYIQSHLPRTTLKRRYQTIYAQEIGSVAAPTAGLHFTSRIFRQLKAKRVEIIKITLHVSLGTFAPLEEKNLREGKLHSEFLEITPDEAYKINQAKDEGKKILAVGTTTTRALETATIDGQVKPIYGETELFIKPGYNFQIVDAMITNFHLPRSSLLMLVSAFCSYPNTPHKFVDFNSSVIGKAYQQAISFGYRFYSFGDAMLIK